MGDIHYNVNVFKPVLFLEVKSFEVLFPTAGLGVGCTSQPDRYVAVALQLLNGDPVRPLFIIKPHILLTLTSMTVLH